MFELIFIYVIINNVIGVSFKNLKEQNFRK